MSVDQFIGTNPNGYYREAPYGTDKLCGGRENCDPSVNGTFIGLVH